LIDPNQMETMSQALVNIQGGNSRINMIN